MKRQHLTLFLYPWELESMPEYSASLPTGTTIGKFWRSRYGSGWYVGAYIEDPDDRPNSRGIVWFEVVLRHGPEPFRYDPPDWHNTADFDYGDPRDGW